MPLAGPLGGSSSLSGGLEPRGLPNPNRLRQTANNNQGSHKPAASSGLVAPTYTNPGGITALPSLSPADTASYYSQLQNLQYGYAMQAAAIRAQRVGVKSALQPILADIKREKIQGLNDVRAAAIGQGLYGGSAALEKEVGIHGLAASARAEAKTGVINALQALKLQNQASGGALQIGLAGLQAQKLAMQQSQLASQLQQNTIVSGTEGSVSSSGNIQTGVPLAADSPLLRNYQGTTLQQPAIHTLRAATKAGIDIVGHLTSSYRTPEQQAALYAAKPGLAAPPGKSLHQQGLAIDVDSTWLAANPKAREWLLANGWHQFDAAKEPWHFSYGTTG